MAFADELVQDMNKRLSRSQLDLGTQYDIYQIYRREIFDIHEAYLSKLQKKEEEFMQRIFGAELRLQAQQKAEKTAENNTIDLTQNSP